MPFLYLIRQKQTFYTDAGADNPCFFLQKIYCYNALVSEELISILHPLDDAMEWNYTTMQSSFSVVTLQTDMEIILHTFCDTFYAVVPKGQAQRIEAKITIPKSVKAPVYQGDKIGKIDYYLNGNSIGYSDIVSTVDIDNIDFWTLFLRVFSKFVIK